MKAPQNSLTTTVIPQNQTNKDNAQKFKQGKSRAEDASKKKEKVFFIANGG
jgi:hypothetical protein